MFGWVVLIRVIKRAVPILHKMLHPLVPTVESRPRSSLRWPPTHHATLNLHLRAIGISPSLHRRHSPNIQARPQRESLFLFLRRPKRPEARFLLCCKEGTPLIFWSSRRLTALVSLAGTIRRLIRRRLQCGRPQWPDHHGRLQGAPRGFRLHGQRARGIPVLLRQRDEYLGWEDGWFRNLCMIFHVPLPKPLSFPFALSATYISLHCIPPNSASHLSWHLSLSLTGRERIPRRLSPLQTRYLPRTNDRSRRIHLQSLQLSLHHKPQPEIFPNEGEPEYEHGQEYRESDI